jgi:hypothetical protein
MTYSFRRCENHRAAYGRSIIHIIPRTMYKGLNTVSVRTHNVFWPERPIVLCERARIHMRTKLTHPVGPTNISRTPNFFLFSLFIKRERAGVKNTFFFFFFLFYSLDSQQFQIHTSIICAYRYTYTMYKYMLQECTNICTSDSCLHRRKIRAEKKRKFSSSWSIVDLIVVVFFFFIR